MSLFRNVTTVPRIFPVHPVLVVGHVDIIAPAVLLSLPQTIELTHLETLVA